MALREDHRKDAEEKPLADTDAAFAHEPAATHAPCQQKTGTAGAHFCRVMSVVASSIARIVSSFARAVRWSLSTVDDEPEFRIAPLPGPAHGPIHAIDVRVGKDRRRF